MTPREVNSVLDLDLSENWLLTSKTDRTSELRKKGFEGRRLGPVQMTTDTAVRVTRLVVEGKSKLLSDGFLVIGFPCLQLFVLLIVTLQLLRHTPFPLRDCH